MSYSRERLPVLDGLRFFAAFTVLMAHYVLWVVCIQGIDNHLTSLITTLAGIGMPLFFLLSGFVIHYNYNQINNRPKGIKEFLVARFSRLYPLFILLFLIELILTIRFKRGACGGQAGERLGVLFALPYYLTLTQDWIFGVIGKKNLIYQYGMLAPVTWSISLEVFFYFTYIFVARFVNRQSKIKPQIFWVFFFFSLSVIYLVFCHHFEPLIDRLAEVGFGKIATVENGYDNSLLRWLYYFCPLVNLPAFFIGLILANIYIKIQDKPLSTFERAFSPWLVLGSLLIALTSHFLLYGPLGSKYLFFGRTGSILNVPLIAAMIFCFVRYASTSISRFFSHTLFVKLGESSYSIYLLHAFLAREIKPFFHLQLNPWLLFVLSIIAILVVSRLTYLLIERPAQKYVRRKLLGNETDAVRVFAEKKAI